MTRESGQKAVTTRQKGVIYEAKAAEFLESHGCVIRERNFRCPLGEIDLIIEEGSEIVFVEVKYRKNLEKGWPEEAVGPKKQARIRNAAAWYLRGRPVNTFCRFDVISILNTQIKWIKNAF